MTAPAALNYVAATVCSQRSLTLVDELGTGAFKRAYLVEKDGARYALKVAPITPSLRPRFEREADALRGCSHPAIAVLHDVFPHSADGHEYWVSIEEFLAGGTLAERCIAGPLDPALVRHIGLTLTSALDHLRTRNLVHRDIKPANILFRTGNAAVLTDFGIVRMLDAPTLTQDFLPIGPGTPRYAAAEQLLNEQRLIDWRTDQFGLAIVLAECVLGHHPFDTDGDLPHAIARVARREPVPEATRERLASAGFPGLVKAMAPWPAYRYRMPNMFHDALSVN